MPELALWTVFVASLIFQLSLSPTTFLNYCFVTSVEEFVKKDIVKKSLVEAKEEDEDDDMWMNGSASYKESLAVNGF